MESPQLIRYNYLYQKKQFSRAFAPLAETYRKMAMYDEAMGILKKGINLHKDYIHGYIVLARCHRDLGEYARAYDVLTQVNNTDSDNYAYIELKAQLAYKLAYYKDALSLYKNLSDIDRTKKYHARIQELEQLCADRKENFNQDIEVTYGSSIAQTDDWVQFSFSHDKAKTDLFNDMSTDVVDTDEMVSMTLLNLYKEQGLYTKAIEVANAMIKRDPLNDELIELRNSLVSKKVLEKEIERFEEDDELSDDHVVENGRYCSVSDNEQLSELELKLKAFQEKVNLKSAQVQLREL